MSKFPQLADRLQQGMLNGLYLGRLLDNDAAHGGFVSDPAFRVDDEGPVDGTNPPVIDTEPALLQRQQPGRDLRRRPDGRLAGLHPRIAGRRRDELLGAAQPLGRLRHLRDRPRPGLPGRAQPAAGPLDGPDALGPRRVERLRAPDHRQPAAEHPAARGPDERRLRRPSGHQLHRPTRWLGRSAREDPHPDRLRRALARCRRRSGASDDLDDYPYTAARRSSTGTAARSATTRTRRRSRGHARHQPAADRERPEPARQRPARVAAARPPRSRRWSPTSCSRTRRATSPTRVPGRPASTSRSAVPRAR